MIITKSNKINLPDEMHNHLTHVLEYELWDQFIEYLKHTMKLKNITEPYDVMPSDNLLKIDEGKPQVKNRTPYHKEFNEGKNKIIKYNRLFPDRIYNALQQLHLPTIDETKVLSFWLASYSYEFFFVQMPRYELIKSTLPASTKLVWASLDTKIPDFQLTKQLFKSDDIFNSFASLKKGFSLLFLPYTFAIMNDDMGDEEFGKLSTTSKSSILWLRQLLSEGYQPTLKTMYHIEDIPQNEWSSFTEPDLVHNSFPMMNTFFVILFADLAEDILKSNNYNFRKNTQFESDTKNSLLKFLLKDFMPLVLNKIKYYMDSPKGSGLGVAIYLNMSKATLNVNKKRCDINIDDSIHKITIPIFPASAKALYPKMDSTFLQSSQPWMDWYNEKVNHATKYLEWAENQENKEYFDIMKNAKTVDDLLNHTFDDRRKNRH